MPKTLGIFLAKHMKSSGTVSPHSQLGVSALDLESTPKPAPDHQGAVSVAVSYNSSNSKP